MYIIIIVYKTYLIRQIHCHTTLNIQHKTRTNLFILYNNLTQMSQLQILQEIEAIGILDKDLNVKIFFLYN